MSLDNVHLPKIVIQNLFKNFLTDVNNERSIKAERTISLDFLGDNDKKIVLLVDYPKENFISDNHLTFLIEILNACKLKLGDIALVNMTGQTALDYQFINKELNPRIVIMFDVQPSALNLPFNIPQFQVQSFNNQMYLHAPSLSELKNDKELKRKLWLSLKQIFSL